MDLHPYDTERHDTTRHNILINTPFLHLNFFFIYFEP
jgi:hypothetical protein